MTIPPDQLAGYCCQLPTLQFDWHLGTEVDDLSVRVLAITTVTCLNCGTDYEFDSQDGIYPVVEPTRLVLRVKAKPVRLQ